MLYLLYVFCICCNAIYLLYVNWFFCSAVPSFRLLYSLQCYAFFPSTVFAELLYLLSVNWFFCNAISSFRLLYSLQCYASTFFLSTVPFSIVLMVLLIICVFFCQSWFFPCSATCWCLLSFVVLLGKCFCQCRLFHQNEVFLVFSEILVYFFVSVSVRLGVFLPVLTFSQIGFREIANIFIVFLVSRG